MTLLDLNDADLASDPEAVVAVKRPVPVAVRFATEAGTLETLEGRVDYDAGAAILRGVKGELWPLSPERFGSLYEPLPGTTAGRDGSYRKRPIPVHAKRILAGPFSVNVGVRQQPLRGRVGDWLVQYSSAKRSVMTDEVFRESYQVISAGTNAAR